MIKPRVPAVVMPQYLRQERAARDTYAQDLASLYTNYLNRAERATLKRFSAASDGLVLEAGCGTGRFLHQLVADGFKVVGIELSGESLRILRASPQGTRVPLAQAELTALPFRAGVFARIYCIQAFQSFLELRDALAALRELGRVLQDGGTLLLTTWNYHLGDRLKGLRVRRQKDGLNFRKFEQHELAELLKEAFPRAEVTVWTGLHFHRKPLKLGDWLSGRWSAALLGVDRLLERTPASSYLGHLLCARVHAPKLAGPV
jgi:SAM-dependent methyltransferase